MEIRRLHYLYAQIIVEDHYCYSKMFGSLVDLLFINE